MVGCKEKYYGSAPTKGKHCNSYIMYDFLGQGLGTSRRDLMEKGRRGYGYLQMQKVREVEREGYFPKTTAMWLVIKRRIMEVRLQAESTAINI